MKYILSVLLTVITLTAPSVIAETANHGAYKIDPAHSTVQFTVQHLGISNLTGRFNNINGKISLNPKGKSSVNISIKTSSVDTNHRKRDTHLRSPDFFNSKQYPAIKFESTKINFDTKGQPTGILGILSMHGKSKVVLLNIKFVGAGKDPWGGYRAGYDATTTIRRSDYGMKFMSGGIGDTIKITINIEAIKL